MNRSIDRWTWWHICRPNILIHIGEELIPSLVELCEGLITLWYFYGVIRSSKHDTSLFRLQLFQTKDIAGAALKQQYYHLAIIAGAAHACMRSMHMYSVSPCMERKKGKRECPTLRPILGLLGNWHGLGWKGETLQRSALRAFLSRISALRPRDHTARLGVCTVHVEALRPIDRAMRDGLMRGVYDSGHCICMHVLSPVPMSGQLML